MPQTFQDDPTLPGRRVWRRSHGAAWGSGLAAVFLGLVTLFMLGADALVARMPGGLLVSLFMLALVAFMAALTAYVWRDMRGKLGGLIILDNTSLTLRLPAGRSLIHDPPSCREIIPFSDLEAVETRVEFYGAQGMGMMQRVWRLRRRNGAPVFLFEDRALGTALAINSMEPVAVEIAHRAGVPLNDLGAAKGWGGFLGAWFARAPDWPAAALTAAQEAALWRRVYITGALVSLVFAATWILAAVL